MVIADMYELLSFSTSILLLILIEGRQLYKKSNLLFMQGAVDFIRIITTKLQKSWYYVWCTSLQFMFAIF